jgi:hypothetical protein
MPIRLSVCQKDDRIHQTTGLNVGEQLRPLLLSPPPSNEKEEEQEIGATDGTSTSSSSALSSSGGGAAAAARGGGGAAASFAAEGPPPAVGLTWPLYVKTVEVQEQHECLPCRSVVPCFAVR